MRGGERGGSGAPPLEKMKKVLEMDGGDSSNVNELNATVDLKTVEVVNLCYVYFITIKNFLII